MKVKLVLARTMHDYNIVWTETKTVEVELPIDKQSEFDNQSDWQVVGAEWPEEEVLGDGNNQRQGG